MKETYGEIDVMKRVCRGQVPNVVELLDNFEDGEYFYAVIKFLPTGDLYHYIMRNWKTTPVPEATVKVILRQLVTVV